MKKLLPENQQHLHNEFLLAVVTKCQTLCEPSSYTDQVKRKTLILGRIEKKPEIPIVERMSPVEIKTVTIPRAVQSKSKPLKVNFDVITTNLFLILNLFMKQLTKIYFYLYFFTESFSTC